MSDSKYSAAEHEWREIVVRIYPGIRTVRSAVFLRKNRGTRLVWERRLNTAMTEYDPDEELSNLSQVLQAVARQLDEVAQRAERL